MRALLAIPLFRLLAVNLVGGLGVAALALCGVLALHPQLTHLIFADHSPGVALALLAGGFAITFGGAVMASAVMQIDRS